MRLVTADAAFGEQRLMFEHERTLDLSVASKAGLVIGGSKRGHAAASMGFVAVGTRDDALVDLVAIRERELRSHF